jgi:hypothetical protein
MNTLSYAWRQKKRNTEISESVWERAKRKLNPEKVKTELLLARDCKKQAVIFVASKRISAKVFGKLYVREKLTQEGTKKLLAKDFPEERALHLAATKLSTMQTEKLRQWPKKKQLERR